MAVLVAERERIERPASLFGPGPELREPVAGGAARTHGDGLGGGLTLDDAIVGAWEGLAAQAAVACPLCDGALRPRSTAGEASGGRCGDCGTTLD